MSKSKRARALVGQRVDILGNYGEVLEVGTYPSNSGKTFFGAIVRYDSGKEFTFRLSARLHFTFDGTY